MREQVETLKHHTDLGAHFTHMTIIGRHQDAIAITHVGQGVVVDFDHAFINAFQGHQYP
ncbi:hypothetical protein D3C80_2219230 [compost metagenome]